MRKELEDPNDKTVEEDESKDEGEVSALVLKPKEGGAKVSSLFKPKASSNKENEGDGSREECELSFGKISRREVDEFETGDSKSLILPSRFFEEARTKAAQKSVRHSLQRSLYQQRDPEDAESGRASPEVAGDCGESGDSSRAGARGITR